MDEFLAVGKITGHHGLKGELKLMPYGGLGEFEWTRVFLLIEGKRSPFTVKSARRQRGSFIIAFEGFNSREETLAMLGSELSVLASELAELPENEFYYADLIGMEVVTDTGSALGRVTKVIDSGAHDVLEINGPVGEVLVPVAEQFIVNVDRESRKIVVHLIEGLAPAHDEEEKTNDEV
jgi:16S rRNA processing protein RimM